jgi:hypothetical protein
VATLERIRAPGHDEQRQHGYDRSRDGRFSAGSSRAQRQDDHDDRNRGEQDGRQPDAGTAESSTGEDALGVGSEGEAGQDTSPSSAARRMRSCLDCVARPVEA